MKKYFQEFLIIAGIALVGYGCWLIYLPAAPIAVGVLFLLFAIAPLLRSG